VSSRAVLKDLDDMQKAGFAKSVNGVRGTGSAIYFTKSRKEDEEPDWFEGGRKGAKRYSMCYGVMSVHSTSLCDWLMHLSNSQSTV